MCSCCPDNTTSSAYKLWQPHHSPAGHMLSVPLARLLVLPLGLPLVLELELELVPVLVLVGDNDSIGCGGELDCNDYTAVVANEKEAYSDPATCVETYVLKDTGHNLSLHSDAPANFTRMLDWIDRRIGESATQPCDA